MKKNSTDDEIGLGWQLRRINGVLTAAHGGTLGGHCLHLQFVPERNLAFSILTNHGDGWRLIQTVERATLQACEGLSLAPNQPRGHRGVSEDMTGHAKPLPQQPALEQYLGKYQRPPVGSVEVRRQDGKLLVSNTANAANATSLVFYGKMSLTPLVVRLILASRVNSSENPMARSVGSASTAGSRIRPEPHPSAEAFNMTRSETGFVVS